MILFLFRKFAGDLNDSLPLNDSLTRDQRAISHELRMKPDCDNVPQVITKIIYPHDCKNVYHQPPTNYYNKPNHKGPHYPHLYPQVPNFFQPHFEHTTKQNQTNNKTKTQSKDQVSIK